MPRKRYGLHCFGCGDLFYDKSEVHRRDGCPYCEECHTNYLVGINDADMYEYEMEKWHRNNPEVDYEQYQIDQANIAKYGEC